jgi:type II secretion system protein G
MNIGFRFEPRGRGFTLIEVAVVLIIIGLITASLVAPLTFQIEQSRNNEARRDLSDAKEALLGFVMANGRLPCPDTSADGLEDACPNTNASAATLGNLPYATLGLKSSDPWGRAYRYRVTNAFTTAFLMTTTGSGAGINRVCTTSACVATEVSNVPLVVFSLGSNGAILPAVTADEQENLDGDGDFVTHNFGTGANQFDDLMVWISREILINRMVTVGLLP